MLSRIIKWALMSKKRNYKFMYIATGIMSNRYNAGAFSFKVSDKELKIRGMESPTQYGFMINREKLDRHFKCVNNFIKYTTVDLIKHPEYIERNEK